MPLTWSRRRVLASLGGAAALGGCTGLFDDDPPFADGGVPTPNPNYTPVEDWAVPTDAPTADVSTNVLVDNVEIPWDLSPASNGDVFLTERVGRVRRFSAGDLEEVLAPEDAIDAESVPPGHDEQSWWVEGGEGGTLGIEAHPDYPDVSYIFVYYTADGSEGRVNRVSRFDVSAGDPGDTEEIVVGDVPAPSPDDPQIHNGGRIEFGPDGHLWVTTGDAHRPDNAQDPSWLGGKVLRVTVDGDPAPDNPGLDDERVYTYGHRNPQGVAWLPDGTAVSTEHGPTARDEINRLTPGGNYGWPDVRGGPDDDDYESYADRDDVVAPLATTGPSAGWAPSGACFYTGEDVPSWRNRLLVGGLASQQVVVATLTPPGNEVPPADDGRYFSADWLDDAYTVTVHTVLEDELGRVRHLDQGPDGELYAITSNRDGRAEGEFPTERDDKLVRIEAE